MSDEWDFYRLRVDDEPASIFLDMGLARSAPLEGMDQAGYLRVRMLRPRDDGLSSQDEYDDLIALEEVVVAKTCGASPTVYVGRDTTQGNRDFFFYTSDADAFGRAVTSAMAMFGGYVFEIGLRPDPEWKVYFEFLYPSGASRQQMSDRRLLETLAKEGDRSDQPRQIDHCAYFPEPAGCGAFAEHARTLGFMIEAGSPRWVEQLMQLKFSRADRPDEMPDVTYDLYNEVSKYGGEYDGWGCEVVE